MGKIAQTLDKWIWRRIRMCYWRMAVTPAMHIALNNKTLEKLGYTSLTSVSC